MRGNFGLFCSFTPKLPRIPIVKQIRTKKTRAHNPNCLLVCNGWRSSTKKVKEIHRYQKRVTTREGQQRHFIFWFTSAFSHLNTNENKTNAPLRCKPSCVAVGIFCERLLKGGGRQNWHSCAKSCQLLQVKLFCTIFMDTVDTSIEWP